MFALDEATVIPIPAPPPANKGCKYPPPEESESESESLSSLDSPEDDESPAPLFEWSITTLAFGAGLLAKRNKLRLEELFDYFLAQ